MSLHFRNAPIAGAIRVMEDSFYVPEFAQTLIGFNPAALLASINASAPWTDPSDRSFKYRGNELQRQKAFLVRADDAVHFDEPPAMLHKYAYPGWQYASMESYRPLQAVPDVQRMANELQQHLTFNDALVVINHAILTRYRDSGDSIGFHSDKMHDITPNSAIISLSLGESREFHIGKPNPDDRKKTIFERAIVLGPGDLFVLGPRTNELHRHAIVPVKDETLIRRARGHVVQPRISIVFRDIATQITRTTMRTKAATAARARARAQQRKAERTRAAAAAAAAPVAKRAKKTRHA